ncbi:hypothetical protein D3C79_755750 [compost metagenome]
MASTLISVADKGDNPNHSITLTLPAPAMPPTLKKPWKPDIMALPLARSTTTACTFIATSIMPIAAPNSNRASAMPAVLSISASKGRSRHNARPASRITGRQPNLPVR